MITKKSDAKALIDTWTPLFATIWNKPCILSFDKHVITDVVVKTVELAKVTGRKNVPDKVEEDGKYRSPMLFSVITDQGELVFTLDDTVVVGIMDGVRIITRLDKPLGNIEQIEVDLRLQK